MFFNNVLFFSLLDFSTAVWLNEKAAILNCFFTRWMIHRLPFFYIRNFPYPEFSIPFPFTTAGISSEQKRRRPFLKRYIFSLSITCPVAEYGYTIRNYPWSLWLYSIMPNEDPGGSCVCRKWCVSLLMCCFNPWK